jgi:hypothetical protein
MGRLFALRIEQVLDQIPKLARELRLRHDHVGSSMPGRSKPPRVHVRAEHQPGNVGTERAGFGRGQPFSPRNWRVQIKHDEIGLTFLQNIEKFGSGLIGIHPAERMPKLISDALDSRDKEKIRDQREDVLLFWHGVDSNV